MSWDETEQSTLRGRKHQCLFNQEDKAPQADVATVHNSLEKEIFEEFTRELADKQQTLENRRDIGIVIMKNDKTNRNFW